MRRLPSPAALALTLLAASCNGGDQLGEPWGGPMQYSTALPDTPYPPRDLAMFDGVSGRVVMWADLMRLNRRTTVLVVDGLAQDPGSVAMRKALIEDVSAAFQPTAVVDCGDDVRDCAARAGAAMQSSRRVVIRCTGSVSVADTAHEISQRFWCAGVTSVALVPSSSRVFRPEDRDLADVVAYTAPTRVVAPRDLAPSASPAKTG